MGSPLRFYRMFVRNGLYVFVHDETNAKLLLVAEDVHACYQKAGPDGHLFDVVVSMLPPLCDACGRELEADVVLCAACETRIVRFLQDLT